MRTYEKSKFHNALRGRGFRCLLTVLLVMSLMVASIGFDSSIYAETTLTGQVTTYYSSTSTVSVRSAATTKSTILTALVNGTYVTILGSTTGPDDNKLWYSIQCTNPSTGAAVTGYMRGDYITIINSDVDDPEYAQVLRNAGFPESYIPSLVALHAKYPNWTFEAVNTGLDWNTVIEKESKNGVNLVPKTYNDSRKSTASGAYNWTTNTWTIYDGSSWVAANPAYIAYYMDPRNFLNESDIFQFENLSYSTSQTLSGVQSIVAGSFLAGTATELDGSAFSYPETLVSIGQELSVSPYLLASRILQEQGSGGTSSMISGKYSGYEGYYNYFNFGASGAGTTTVITTGLTYAKNKGWNTRYKSIYGGAQQLAANYIARGQNTFYFQKFNVVYTASLYGHQYMGNLTAAYTEGRSMAKAYSDKSQAFSFRIPVYNNMPATAVTFTDTGNPNNYLKSLAVDGLSLTPTFSGATTAYSIVVPNSVSAVSVSATAVASTSSLSGTGSYNLAVGNNTISVNCTSQSGSTRTYTITIYRQPSGVGDSDYSVTSSVYSIGTYVTGVAVGTNATDFLNGFATTNCTLQLLNADGSANTGTVCTGNKLAIYVGGVLRATCDVVIYGDVNGDGAVNALDMIQIKRHILGISTLSGTKYAAADANRGNDDVNALDLLAIKKEILGVKKISQ